MRTRLRGLKGRVGITVSPVRPDRVWAIIDAELGKKGWTVVDASAGGVEEVAAAGQLALWLSGSKALFDEHQPIFKAMGKSILHVGELGNAKLVKNAMAMLAAVQTSVPTVSAVILPVMSVQPSR